MQILTFSNNLEKKPQRNSLVYYSYHKESSSHTNISKHLPIRSVVNIPDNMYYKSEKLAIYKL
jgi:hypothetical protein